MQPLNFLDTLILQIDCALRTLVPPKARVSMRPIPAKNIDTSPITAPENKHIAGLMRVNHSGEVCAQALYQGQALTAKLTHIKKQMMDASAEEVDHLAWCEQRLQELGSNPSRLNPIWYGGSLFIGAIAGLCGDAVSLGFVAETEQQVSRHLECHLQDIPLHDKKSRAIIEQMWKDEQSHAAIAMEAGAITLPVFIKKTMGFLSKIMTKSSYYV
jgi:3-demethoxyubiquinol 3-hydroxylase